MQRTTQPPELMTPDEAARWFRRSPSWLRQQRDLVRLGANRAQPLFHVKVCRAWVLGKMSRLDPDALRRLQLKALESECQISPESSLANPTKQGPDADPLAPLCAELTEPAGTAAHE